MRHTGTVFLSKTPPMAGPVKSGVFQLQMFALDRQGAHAVEPWRLVWTGPEAQLFWETHTPAQLAPGAALRITATRARAHVAGRAGAEILAHLESCEIAPPRLPAKREQLLAQEQAA